MYQRKVSLGKKSKSSFLLKPHHYVGLSGKRRLKALIKRLIVILPCFKEVTEEATENQYTQIATRAKTKKGIPTEAKKILIKAPDARTPEENEELTGLLGSLHFYNRYGKSEYEKLIARTAIICYKAGRVIIKQGHMVNDMSCIYYVVRGHLNVVIETVNRKTLTSTFEMVKKLVPGDFFGEVAILFNDVRQSTVTSLTNVELLFITKEDFDAILKDSLEKEWSKVRDALDDLPYFFGNWTDIEQRRCSIVSSVIHFQQGDLILGDGFGRAKMAHFLIDGKCSVIQNMLVKKVKSNNYKLIPDKLIQANHETEFSSEDIEEIYMQTTIFIKGACFGVGECLRNRRYVAESDMIVLTVPQYLLMAHKRFDSYKQFLESRLFTEDELFHSFVYLRKRHVYCRKVFESIKGRASKINFTTIWDVPHYCRVLSPQIEPCKVPDFIKNMSDIRFNLFEIPSVTKIKRKEGLSSKTTFNVNEQPKLLKFSDMINTSG